MNFKRTQDVRMLDVTPTSGHKAMGSEMLTKLASSTSSESEKNSTTPYTVAAEKPGLLGGQKPY